MERGARSDAVRNRGRILQAARGEIARVGPDVAMDDIAKAAGVAVGTLYRHFPSKSDLVAAVAAEVMDQVADDAERAADRVEAGARAAHELFTFIRGAVDALATNHAAKVAAAALGGSAANVAAEHRAERAVATILQAARRDGEVRPDLEVGDIYLLVSSAPYDQADASRARWLELVLPALSAPSIDPAPG